MVDKASDVYASRLEALDVVMYLHEFLFGALGADDVLSIGDESFADERSLALCADEAVVVPMTVLERDEAGATDTCKHIYIYCYYYIVLRCH